MPYLYIIYHYNWQKRKKQKKCIFLLILQSKSYNMSVKVEGLTKIYGAQRAIDNISFEAKKGEVLGFLGPNGAGKTTTMKILTCFVPQTDGKAEICGYNVATHAMEVRHQVGYLPEHNPLYKDMYVREYLDFVANVHRVTDKKKRVAEMVERTGLGAEQHKLIASLSKGYRQRVGLAQAMLHNPDVLILDEPTSGLDPNQLIAIRRLIKELGEEKTVLFSTHIMQEVEALCDRVVIINKGQIVADDRIGALHQLVAGNNILHVEFLQPIDSELFKSIKNIQSIKKITDTRFQIFVVEQHDIRKNIFDFAVQNNLTLLEMHREVSTVENIFQQLTK
jgi:ABC-2 type transport system ATP-binding protein